ncbi:hypothetical protein Tco_0390388 [Tanacetum coccineum]
MSLRSVRIGARTLGKKEKSSFIVILLARLLLSEQTLTRFQVAKEVVNDTTSSSNAQLKVAANGVKSVWVGQKGLLSTSAVSAVARERFGVHEMIHRSGRIDEDVTHRIRTGWMRWRTASGVLCDKRVPLKLKGKFYRVAIRPDMLYGSECWPITKAQSNRVEVAELRMLRWTCGKIMLDMIPNGVFRAELEVESIIHKMREGRMGWFGHVKRKPQTAPVRRVEALFVDGLRRRGRPKLRWEDRLKQDMKVLLLSEDMTSDRNAWRDRKCIGG